MPSLLRDIHSLFFPPVCGVCGRVMGEGSDMVCVRCRWEIPLTGFWNDRENPVAAKLHSSVPIENACSFFYFIHDNGYRNLIHTIKYRGGWKAARKLGMWFGDELRASPLYADIDVVIPVPLHLRRLLSRGYNQSEYLAEGIAKAIGRPMSCGNVRRTKHNRSQTKRSKEERWDNVHGIFAVRNPSRLAGKHILLVDDVLTTGATLISCAETILRAVPDCRLSIATIAVSHNELKHK